MHTFRIKNFQSIKDTSFTVEGFTVLVGENDIGKSSCFRSIHALFNSRSGDAFIKQGESFSEVSCTANGSTITWKKPRKSGASYTLNKQGNVSEFVNLGRSVPDFIGEMGYGELKLKSDSVDPHFSKQREEPFLVANAGSKKVLTEFFSEMLKFGPLAVGTNKATKDLRDLNSDISLTEKQRDSVLEYLESFPDVEALQQEFEILESLLERKELTEKQSQLLSSYSAYKDIPDIPEESFDPEIISELVKLNRSVGLLKQVQAIPCGLELPDNPDTDSVAELNKILGLDFALRSYLALPEVEDLTLPELDEKIVETLSAIQKYLILLDSPEGVDKLETGTYILELEKVLLDVELNKLNLAVSEMGDKVSLLEAGLRSALEEMGECPLCGAQHKREG